MNALEHVIRDLKRRAELAYGQADYHRQSRKSSELDGRMFDDLVRQLGDIMPKAEHDRIVASLIGLTQARPRAEWSPDVGTVLWWKFPIDEPPYVGSPLDLGQAVEIHTHHGAIGSGMVGGWPVYHTHWTPLPEVAEPQAGAP